jgi:tRNA A-37 threonylcarbamoyl transferase component Bud32
VERIFFAEDWQSYFDKFGLKSFDDFFNCDVDFNILKTCKRYVNSVSFGEGSESKTFFIKRFGYCHLEDIFLGLYNFGRLYSQAGCEYENARYLLNEGFATYRPLCYGEQTILGIERRSFVVTEALKGQSLDCFVAENFEKLRMPEKEQIFRELGRTIRKIHNCDINLPDLYIWHLFITKEQSGGYEFAVIDLHRMKYRVSSSKEKTKNLARLDYSMRDEYFDEDLRRVLIEAYNGKESELLFSEVRQGSAKLLRRRKPKPYNT